MAKRSKAFRMFDFSGGLNTKAPVTSLNLNEAVDLQNIVLLPRGGFEKRRGNTLFNSSAMSSGAAVSGLGYYRQSDGDDFLMAVSGTNLFKSDSLDGTMDSITGALTITTGQDNLWTMFTMNDSVVGVGGAPDAPWVWTGTGNGAALGGSPPSGNFGLTANNRAFIGNTTANSSTIYWSILGDHTGWSGSGSGSQDVSKNDGDTLVGAAVLDVDRMLLFKQNSIHLLVITTAPFPLFPMFDDVGAVSKRAIVTIDGIVYFITPEPRMKATDGRQVISFPDTIDDVWDGLNSARLKYIHGIYYKRLNWIVWFVSNGSASTHDTAIIWDITRKVWLKCPTGYKMNSASIAQDRIFYAGAYDGKVYRQDVSGTYTDASETSPGSINAYLRTGWMDINTLLESKVVPFVDINFTTQSSGNFLFSYGFDFNQDRKTETINMTSGGAKYDSGFKYGQAKYSGITDKSKFIFLRGQGKFMQFLFKQNTPTHTFSINGIEFPIKSSGTRALKTG